ncbi:MAG: flagellin, partial [Comamonas sp.]
DGSFSGAVFQVGSNAGDNITVGALKNAKIDALGSIQVGESSFDVPKGTIEDLGEVEGLSIAVGDTAPIGLGKLEKASSEQERLGQVVAAINAKSADTGVTAFLETDEAGNSTLSLRSDSAKAVQILGGTDETVGFTGATLAIDANTYSAAHADVEAVYQVATVDHTNVVERMTAAFAAVGKEIGTTFKGKLDGFDTAYADAEAATPGDGAALLATLKTEFDTELKAAQTAVAGDLDIEAVDEATSGMSSLSVATQKDAWTAIKQIDSAIDQVNASRADLGALQARFERSIENIDIMNENITASRGRIVDADFATETANLSRAQILQQAGTAMVAQANQLPQGVLSLLQ